MSDPVYPVNSCFTQILEWHTKTTLFVFPPGCTEFPKFSMFREIPEYSKFMATDNRNWKEQCDHPLSTFRQKNFIIEKQTDYSMELYTKCHYRFTIIFFITKIFVVTQKCSTLVDKPTRLYASALSRPATEHRHTLVGTDLPSHWGYEAELACVWVQGCVGVWIRIRMLSESHSFRQIQNPADLQTRLCRIRTKRGKTNLNFTEARDSEWQWHQLGHMQICTSLQADNHASTPPLSFLQAGCPSCRPTNSIKALKAFLMSV